jgi:hypothetical protein
VGGAFSLIPPGGKWYWVDGVNGSASNDGLAPVLNGAGHGPLLTVAAAYAKTVDLKHDVVAVLAGATATQETAVITWDKIYTHLVGFGSPVRTGQRSRIVCAAEDLSPFFIHSGSGCIFANVRLWQGQADADSKILFSVTGARNYYWNVDFAGGGHADQAIDGGASLHINGGSENLFERCSVGVDTIPWATGMAGLVFAATGGAARNVWRDCIFNAYAGNNGARFVELLGNSGIDRYQFFEHCQFINLSATAMLSAFVVAAGFDANNKRVLLTDCEMIGAADWDASNRGILYLSGGTHTAGGFTGLYQVSAVT